MRLFVALRLDEVLRRSLAAQQHDLERLDRKHDVRWVDPDGAHLTLRFLGEVDPDRVPALQTRLGEALRGLPAPRLGLAGLGGFPSLAYPRVLWIQLSEDGERLGSLQTAIEAAVVALGWEPEERPFQPHLTLGRVREKSRGKPRSLGAELRSVLSKGFDPEIQHRSQNLVCVIQSRLSRSGARYRDLQTWILEDPEA